MKDVKCPICDSLEKGLNLEETGGWFICSHCNGEIQIMEEEETVSIPVLNLKLRDAL